MFVLLNNNKQPTNKRKNQANTIMPNRWYDMDEVRNAEVYVGVKSDAMKGVMELADIAMLTDMNTSKEWAARRVGAVKLLADDWGWRGEALSDAGRAVDELNERLSRMSEAIKRMSVDGMLNHVVADELLYKCDEGATECRVAEVDAVEESHTSAPETIISILHKLPIENESALRAQVNREIVIEGWRRARPSDVFTSDDVAVMEGDDRRWGASWTDQEESLFKEVKGRQEARSRTHCEFDYRHMILQGKSSSVSRAMVGSEVDTFLQDLREEEEEGAAGGDVCYIKEMREEVLSHILDYIIWFPQDMVNHYVNTDSFWEGIGVTGGIYDTLYGTPPESNNIYEWVKYYGVEGELPPHTIRIFLEERFHTQ